jgi:hypothetical protein
VGLRQLQRHAQQRDVGGRVIAHQRGSHQPLVRQPDEDQLRTHHHMGRRHDQALGPRDQEAGANAVDDLVLGVRPRLHGRRLACRRKRQR